MREQLISYINLLFAGSVGTDDVKEEILQNTLDRYDGLVAQGKSPEAAYSLAISGIGDIGEILSGNAHEEPSAGFVSGTEQAHPEQANRNKLLRAISTGLYIICAVPLFMVGSEAGLCLTLLIVAAATILKIISGSEQEKKIPHQLTPHQKLKKSIHSILWTVVLVIYFLLSFSTGDWYITWLMFPIGGAVNGLVGACMDLREEMKNEN